MAIEKAKIMTLLVAVVSLVGIILIAATDFGGFYMVYPYSGNRYSCLAGCEYNVGADTAGMIIGIILLAFQLIIAFNVLVPKPFIKKLPGIKLVSILGLATIGMILMGGISFSIYASDLYNEWWLGAAFYGGLSAGLLNTVLALLIARIKK